ncbi:MAG TPA: hypothetical protein VD998_00450, partial [Verrucomicrobiae bacterium]|nr:hypothetical protein [Verrucomicrobiae bacterium]
QPPQLIGQVERSPLEVLEKEFVTIGENTYSGYIKLKNPNLDWGVPNLAYRVEIKTSSGSLITSTTNESFILPASEKYLVLPRFTTTFSPSEMDFTVLESKYVLKPENFPQLSLEMQRIQVSHEDNETIVSAVIKNNSPFTISQVDLLATLYTDRGELKVINYTNINDLVSGELRSFQIGWPGIVTGNLVAEISPEVNIFSKDILKTQGSVSPFDR